MLNKALTADRGRGQREK